MNQVQISELEICLELYIASLLYQTAGSIQMQSLIKDVFKKIIGLKVSKSRKQFLELSILPKNKR